MQLASEQPHVYAPDTDPRQLPGSTLHRQQVQHATSRHVGPVHSWTAENAHHSPHSARPTPTTNFVVNPAQTKHPTCEKKTNVDNTFSQLQQYRSHPTASNMSTIRHCNLQSRWITQIFIYCGISTHVMCAAGVNHPCQTGGHTHGHSHSARDRSTSTSLPLATGSQVSRQRQGTLPPSVPRSVSVETPGLAASGFECHWCGCRQASFVRLQGSLGRFKRHSANI